MLLKVVFFLYSEVKFLPKGVRSILIQNLDEVTRLKLLIGVFDREIYNRIENIGRFDSLHSLGFEQSHKFTVALGV